MKRFRFLLPSLLLAFWFIASPLLRAQDSLRSFGFICEFRDKAGGVAISDLSLSLINEESGETKTLTTDEFGRIHTELVSGYQYQMLPIDKTRISRRASIEMSTDENGRVSELCLSGFAYQEVLTDTATGKKALFAGIFLSPVEVNSVFNLDNVYYDYDKADIRSDAEDALDGVYQLMADNPQIKVEFAAFTDCVGDSKYNKKLSQRRADAAVAYLRAKGIEASRMRAKGYGEDQPRTDCACEDCTAADHAQNRRTELRIIGVDED